MRFAMGLNLIGNGEVCRMDRLWYVFIVLLGYVWSGVSTDMRIFAVACASVVVNCLCDIKDAIKKGMGGAG